MTDKLYARARSALPSQRKGRQDAPLAARKAAGSLSVLRFIRLECILSSMPQRSLPERTVDAWVSTAICSAFPHAQIWGPTQALDATNWDYGLSIGDGKIFILEDKGTSPVVRTRRPPLQTHKIDVDRSQLDWYCAEVEPHWGVPVYYVMPNPPWLGPHTGPPVVPHQASYRSSSPHGPFEEWAFVSRCHSLRSFLGARSSLETHRLPLLRERTLAEFLKGVRDCILGRAVSGSIKASDWNEKRPEEQPTLFPQSNVGSPEILRPQVAQRVGSALAVFIPSEDLPGWRPT
jgi:hypothetical protein